LTKILVLFNLKKGEAGMVEQCTYEKYELKKKLETIKSKSGRSKELISLYIPSDKQISDVTNHLSEEHGQASNIMSKYTRTNVQGALVHRFQNQYIIQ
jgi:peptide chain release factor subunit 1